MSQQQLPADLQPVGNRQARRLPVVVAVGVLTLVGALASCGGDDDAADGSGPATAAVETTAPDDTASEGSAEVGDSTDAPDVSTAEDSVAVDGTTGDGTEASRSTPADTSTNSSPSAAVDAATAPSDPAGANDAGDTSDAAAADDSTDPSGPAESTDPSGSTGDSTDGSGPTTTGPTCEFTENSDYPLERCDTGPAVAVLQQTLQIEGFQIGVDGLFGDETLYAVRAFQEEGSMTVDGIVGEATWTALDPQNVGSDDDGNGVVDPDEVDLAE